MKYKIECKPAYSLLKVFLNEEESIVAEPGSMVLTKGKIDIKTSTRGILRGFLRSFAGESLFLNTYTARSKSEIWLAPSLPGDIKYIPLKEESYIIQDSSYLAHHGNIEVSVAWRGLRGILAEGEMIWIRVKGSGGVWVNSYGGMEELSLGYGDKATIDNFHFVAMKDGMNWKVRKFGGWKSFLFGGEGLVFDVEGPGSVHLQTRILPPFARLLRKYLKK